MERATTRRGKIDDKDLYWYAFLSSPALARALQWTSAPESTGSKTELIMKTKTNVKAGIFDRPSL